MKTLLVAVQSQRRQLLGEALGRRKHEVTVVESADAACTAFQSGGHPLVILEAGDPDGECVRLCRRLRTLARGNRCVILAAGELPQPDQIRRLLAAGADDYLTDLDNTQKLDVRLSVAEHRLRTTAGCGPIGEPARPLPIECCPVRYHAPYGVARTSLDGRFLDANPALVAMLGYDSEEDLLAADLAQDVYRDPETRARLMDRAADGPVAVELQWKRKDGTPIDVRAQGRIVCDDTGEPLWLEGIVEDVTDRKRVEEALRQCEQKFDSFVRQSVYGYAETDLDGNLRFANQRVGEIFGFAPEEVVGEHFSRFVDERDLPRASADFQRALTQTEAVFAEYAGRTTDGSLRFMEVNTLALCQGGRPVGIQYTLLDITDRKRAERALHESEARLRSLIYNMPDSVTIIDRRGKISFVNRAAPELSMEEVIGSDGFQYIVPEHLPETRNAVQLAFEKKEVQTVICQDVAGRWWETRIVPMVEDGTAEEAMAIATEITQRRRTEQDLRKSENQLRSLFENLPDVVIIVDQNATIQYLNRTVSGTSAEDRIGTEGFDSIAPEYREACRQALQRAIETRQVQAMKCLGAYGTWWDCRLVPMIEEGQVRNVMIISTDVSEQRKATQAVQKEQQLLRHLIDLHERDRQLTAYEIHDGFSQYLTGALYNLQGFRELHAKEPSRAWKTFDAGLLLIRRSIDETRRLIGGLRPPILDESGIVAAVDYLACETEEREEGEVEFVHDVRFQRLAPPLESAIFRVVQESLTNARRHSQSPRIRIELTQQNDRIRISVRDWGIGFDPSKVEEGRFGLRGIRERVRLFGGQVTIETAPDQGTHISVELPLVVAAAEPSGP